MSGSALRLSRCCPPVDPCAGLRNPEFRVGALFEHAYGDARLMIWYVDAIDDMCLGARTQLMSGLLGPEFGGWSAF